MSICTDLMSICTAARHSRGVLQVVGLLLGTLCLIERIGYQNGHSRGVLQMVGLLLGTLCLIERIGYQNSQHTTWCI